MYVPDDKTLGNPGVFGFISSAAKKVGEALGISKVKISLPSPTVTVTPTAQAVQAAAMGAVQQIPPWVLPAAIAGGVLLLVTTLGRRR